MQNKIFNKDYIVSIDRVESLVQIKIVDQLQLLNFQFDDIESAINYSMAIVESNDFINLHQMMIDIKTKRKSLRTAKNKREDIISPTLIKPVTIKSVTKKTKKKK